ncbi:MAG: diphthine--ammonia ligase [Nanoarchaeota archaeon]|nr:diphthine--ammonia ligase [Nanoarchaeota archaeon]
MKVGILFSGGKDSMYAAFLAKQQGHTLSCLISIQSENPYSYMFHTPSISQVKKQAEKMKIPLFVKKTKGEKEKELIDLENVIKTAINKYKIQGIVTGAVESVYQSSRIEKICNKLKIKCINPLWKKYQNELLKELINHKFDVIIIGVAAQGLEKDLLGKKINREFIELMKKTKGINAAGEGGEFETFVLNCPLFSSTLKVIEKKIISEGQNHRMEITVK